MEAAWAWETPRVLIVEDDASTRRLLRHILEQEDLAVEEAADGHAALESVEKWQPSLVLLDLSLPDMDGFEVLRRMRGPTSGHEVPVLVLTALNDERSVEQSMATGATDYLNKPIRRAVLIHRVRRELLARRTAAIELELQTARANVLSVVEAAPDAILTFNAEGVVEFANAAAREMFGSSMADIVGHPIGHVIPEPAGDVLFQPGTRIEGEGRRMDGTRFPVDLAVASFQANDTTGFVLMVRDITEAVRLREEMLVTQRRLEEQLSQSARLVKTMVDRELRMTELKRVIRDLRQQLIDAGLIPVADDPLVDHFPSIESDPSSDERENT